MKNHLKAVGNTVCLLALALFLAGCAQQPAVTPTSHGSTRDAALEKDFQTQLARIDPAAVPIYNQATAALDAKDYATAKKLYEQVGSMAPGFSAAFRRLGYIQSSLNDLEGAIGLTEQALKLEPNGYNQTALAALLLQRNTPKDSQDAFNLASSAAKTLPDDEQTNLVLLMSAAAVNNVPVARQADQHLLAIAPDSYLGHYFAGLLAGASGNWEEAETQLKTAQSLGMSAATVQHALDEGISTKAAFSRVLRWGAIATVLWLLGLGIIYLLGSYLSKATIRALNDAQPAVEAQIGPAERRIRSIYRALIGVLSVYFYISIPFVVLLLLLLVGGIFYVFMVIGTIPIQLSIILVLMVFASLIAIARGLFSRRKDLPPGRRLERSDAPELWSLVEEVAHKLDTRAVDAIYVTPGTEIAVNEKGSLLQKLRGGGTRNLMLGMGVLAGLTQGQLAAILAHEYGHFSNRDTAGGDMAHRVFTSLDQMAKRLIQGRAAQIYNPVWLFVIIYQRIFLRVTLGASRLQEVLADRYAAIAYGGRNFIAGLESVIRQAIAFPLQANYEVRRLHELKQPVNNLYELPVQADLQEELEKQVAKSMKRPTSQYDSHPAPQQRIAWIERLQLAEAEAQDNPRPALDLFPNPEQLQREMTGRIMKNARK